MRKHRIYQRAAIIDEANSFVYRTQVSMS